MKGIKSVTLNSSVGLALVLALLLQAGCGKRSEAPAERAVVAEAAPPPPPAAPAAAPASGAAAPEKFMHEDKAKDGLAAGKPVQPDLQLNSGIVQATPGSRPFIRTANLNFRVQDVYQAALQLEDATVAHGGFVLRNEINTDISKTQRRPNGDGKLLELSEYVVRGNLQVRVPSARTQEFLRAIAKHMQFLEQRHFAARDAQFDLLREQLEFARNQETQQELQKLGQAAENQANQKLGQKGDIVNNRNYFKAARDAALLRQKEFEDQVNYATLDLAFHQLPQVTQHEVVDVDAVFHQHRAPFWSRVLQGLRGGWDGLLDSAVNAVYLWPLWTLLLILFAVWRKWRRAARS